MARWTNLCDTTETMLFFCKDVVFFQENDLKFEGLGIWE